MTINKSEINNGDRFAFGANWARFLSVLDEERILQAELSLKKMIGVDTLEGKTFLDAGCGSGLFSLAARRLGARVISFDYDPQSVLCTSELKDRYFVNDDSWTIETGSVLDIEFLDGLDECDILYSWGVLHHTGAMWLALENVISKVKREDNILIIAIYNDQGWKSHVWWLIKLVYNKLPHPVQNVYAYTLGMLVNSINILKYTLKLKPMDAIRPLLNYKKDRGMSMLHDLIDWIGGFPFEFSDYDILQQYLEARGFELLKGIQASSLGCHELVVKRISNK